MTIRFSLHEYSPTTGEPRRLEVVAEYRQGWMVSTGCWQQEEMKVAIRETGVWWLEIGEETLDSETRCQIWERCWNAVSDRDFERQMSATKWRSERKQCGVHHTQNRGEGVRVEGH